MKAAVDFSRPTGLSDVEAVCEVVRGGEEGGGTAATDGQRMPTANGFLQLATQRCSKVQIIQALVQLRKRKGARRKWAAAGSVLASASLASHERHMLVLVLLRHFVRDVSVPQEA